MSKQGSMYTVILRVVDSVVMRDAYADNVLEAVAEASAEVQRESVNVVHIADVRAIRWSAFPSFAQLIEEISVATNMMLSDKFEGELDDIPF